MYGAESEVDGGRLQSIVIQPCEREDIIVEFIVYGQFWIGGVFDQCSLSIMRHRQELLKSMEYLHEDIVQRH